MVWAGPEVQQGERPWSCVARQARVATLPAAGLGDSGLAWWKGDTLRPLWSGQLRAQPGSASGGPDCWTYQKVVILAKQTYII